MKPASAHILLVGSCLFACFFFWFGLGDVQIAMWDEATYAMNAIDMARSKNFLLTSTYGIPDFYNSQPQLVLWLQALGIKLFGITEFAVRYPSALSASLLVIFIAFYFKKEPLIAAVAVIFLAVCQGYNVGHVTRSGDIDSTLVFFESLAVLSWFAYLFGRGAKFQVLFFVAFFLAVMTKGVAILMLMPGVLLASILLGKWKFVLDKRNYIYFSLLLAVLTVYYYLREQYAPGYLADVYEDSFGRFFGNTHAWEEFSWNYYLKEFWEKDLLTSLHLLLLAPLAFLSKNKKLRNTAFYLAIVAAMFLFVISTSSTKTYWYDAPIYPLLAVLIGLGAKELLERLLAYVSKPYLVGGALMILLFIFPTVKQYAAIAHPPEKIYDMELEGAFLKHCLNQDLINKPFTVLKEVKHPAEHYDQIWFYKEQAASSYNLDGTVQVNLDQLNEQILICQPELGIALADKYLLDTLFQWKQGCVLLTIKGSK